MGRSGLKNLQKETGSIRDLLVEARARGEARNVAEEQQARRRIRLIYRRHPRRGVLPAA